jgi:uncharacterized OB-fold protein
VSGRGQIVSYTMVHRPQHESFYAEAPICFIAVGLDEGPILYSQLLDRNPDGQLLRRRVIAAFREVSAGTKLLYFRLADA